MNYSNGSLSVTFRKPKLLAGTQVRTYADVPSKVAVGLFYLESPTDILKYYATNIRKKYQVITVK